MSQDYHQSSYNFSNGFERSQQQQHMAQQIPKDKLRIQGFDPLVGIEENETVGMLSEMFSFPTATELLESQISQSYRNHRQPPPIADWFLHRQGMVAGGGLEDSKNHVTNINAESAAAMQLFLMNSQQQRSPSPPSTSSTLHMLLPNHPSSSSSNLQSFHAAPGGSFGQFTWVPNSENNHPSEIQGVVEGQGLSLSLSSSLQQLEAVKAEELRMRGGGGMLCFGQAGGGSSNSVQYQFKNLNTGAALQGGVVGQSHHLQVGLGSSIGAVNVLRNSKYAKAAQELLEEFCSVGRGQFKKNKLGRQSKGAGGDGGGGGSGGANSSSSSKDVPPLSASDRLEHQRRKVKLLSMLDEVDRRFNHYCEQMQMVVNSFDMVMGFGAAVPYTCLAQKAMSRHFRCLKDAIAAQLKNTCELLGEKDGGTSGVTKGETPRLKILDQSLRQQRAFHQMGMMEQEAWRPQRGLPDRSVNVLRAWLFEHFLHPYPNDADKHLLARQTGLSRNQVSNWFINARVRLWKPMVEEMYQQEAKDDDGDDDDDDADPPQRDHSSSSTSAAAPTVTNSNNAQTPTPHEINAQENDPSFVAINSDNLNRQRNQAKIVANTNNNAQLNNGSAAVIRFGSSAGDVSLTLGLRHAGNVPEKVQFPIIRDFGG